MGEIKASISLDLGEIGKKLQEADNQVRIREIRIEALKKRIEEGKREAEEMERAAERAVHHFAKNLVKSEVSGLVGSFVSELGIPEAAQPIVHVGTAALRGASIGGIFGAGAFASVALVEQLREAMTRDRERLEKLEGFALKSREEANDLRIAMKEIREEAERRLERELEQVRMEAETEFQDYEMNIRRSLPTMAD